MIRMNARGEVVVPFFRVGEAEFDLVALLDALNKAATKANR